MKPTLKSWADGIAIAIAFGCWFTFTALLEARGVDWLYSFRFTNPQAIQYVVIPYWGLLLGWIPAHLPEPFGYGLWTLVGMLLLITAARYNKAPLLFLSLSYQFQWILFYGQIDGYVIFGITLGFWALQKSRPYVLGVALMLALIKPQFGGLPALFLFGLSSDKKKTLLSSALIGLISIILWPTWISDIIQNQWTSFLTRQENISTNTSPGFPVLICLPLIVLAFVVRLPAKQKLVVLVATSLLVSPYATIYSQLALLSMGLPSLFYLFAFIPWGVAIFLGPFDHWGWGFLFPLGVWGYFVLPALWRRLGEQANHLSQNAYFAGR
jgi:hypothetical protein